MTRKLTLDYGLRYDYQTYLKEQYGRMPTRSLTFLIREYGQAVWGPRFMRAMEAGAAIASSRTIIRMRLGPASDSPTRSTPRRSSAAASASSTRPRRTMPSCPITTPYFYAVNGARLRSVPFMNNLTSGNPFLPVIPMAWLRWFIRTLTGGISRSRPAAWVCSPDSPFITIDRSSRPAPCVHVEHWVQREMMRDLVVEAGYVGNRGVWFTAPELAITDYNPLKPSELLKNGTVSISTTRPIGHCC